MILELLAAHIDDEIDASKYANDVSDLAKDSRNSAEDVLLRLILLNQGPDVDLWYECTFYEIQMKYYSELVVKHREEGRRH